MMANRIRQEQASGGRSSSDMVPLLTLGQVSRKTLIVIMK